MSFGYSISDVVLLGQVAWRVVQNSRKACGEHAEFTREVSALHVVLQRLQQETEQPENPITKSAESCQRELRTLVGDCEKVVRMLDRIILKYNALSPETRGRRGLELWQKVKFGNSEVADLRDLREKAVFYTSSISFYLNVISMGSIGRVEKRMDESSGDLKDIKFGINTLTAKLMSQKSTGSSVLTGYAEDDRRVWKEFRRGLIKKGFSSSTLHKYKGLIMDYIEELGDRDLLDDCEPTGKAQLRASAAMDGHAQAEAVETLAENEVLPLGLMDNDLAMPQLGRSAQHIMEGQKSREESVPPRLSLALEPMLMPGIKKPSVPERSSPHIEERNTSIEENPATNLLPPLAVQSTTSDANRKMEAKAESRAKDNNAALSSKKSEKCGKLQELTQDKGKRVDEPARDGTTAVLSPAYSEDYSPPASGVQSIGRNAEEGTVTHGWSSLSVDEGDNWLDDLNSMKKEVNLAKEQKDKQMAKAPGEAKEDSNVKMEPAPSPTVLESPRPAPGSTALVPRDFFSQESKSVEENEKVEKEILPSSPPHPASSHAAKGGDGPQQASSRARRKRKKAVQKPSLPPLQAEVMIYNSGGARRKPCFSELRRSEECGSADGLIEDCKHRPSLGESSESDFYETYESYAAPSPEHAVPASNHGAPNQPYAAPPKTYAAPYPSRTAPAPYYNVPPPHNYAAPPPVYAAPPSQPNYTAPPQASYGAYDPYYPHAGYFVPT